MSGKTFWEKVKVKINANIYFEGAVQSRTIIMQDGTRKTLGVYLPGEYVFDSENAEVVKITKGEVEVLFPNDEKWREIGLGESYNVPSNCTFQVRCNQITEYVCDYL